MKTTQQNTYEPQLTDEEIQQIREMLRKSNSIKKKTAASSKKSFINWLHVINIALSIINKIQQIDWCSIQRLFSMFS
jgi:hypothetical protein